VEKIEQVPARRPIPRGWKTEWAGVRECGGAKVARQFGLPESTVRVIDLRIWNGGQPNGESSAEATRRGRNLYGEKIQFVTVRESETGEPYGSGGAEAGNARRFFRTQYVVATPNIQAACVDMWQPFTASITEWAPHARSYTTSFIS